MTFLRKYLTFFTLLITLIFTHTSLATPASTQTLSPEILNYLTKIEKKYHFDKKYLITLFQQTHFNPEIINKINHPYEAKPWPKYRTLFLTQQRIENGVAFWEAHKKVLQEAQEKYGVPANMIVAIIGVETGYGQHTGPYSVMEALTTLSFYYPARAKFFRQELTQYLLMTREQHLDPLKLTGSYAGAIGIPQFMPSTYRRYAVDYSQQGSADLVHNVDDAIFSVANYLNKMGWKKNQPVALPLKSQASIDRSLITVSATPKLHLKELKKYGVNLPSEAKMYNEIKAAVINMQKDSNLEDNYWLTFANFRAIMRYNPRVNYAMAVYQLGEAITHANKSSTIGTRTTATPARAA